MPQFHPGLSALRYSWSFGNVRKGDGPFCKLYVFTISGLCVFQYEVWQPRICATQVSCSECTTSFDRDHASHRLPAGIGNKPNAVRIGFPLMGDLSSGPPSSLADTLLEPHCKLQLSSLSPSQESVLHPCLRNLPGSSHFHPTFLDRHFSNKYFYV